MDCSRLWLPRETTRCGERDRRGPSIQQTANSVRRMLNKVLRLLGVAGPIYSVGLPSFRTVVAACGLIGRAMRAAAERNHRADHAQNSAAAFALSALARAMKRSNSSGVSRRSLRGEKCWRSMDVLRPLSDGMWVRSLDY